MKNKSYKGILAWQTFFIIFGIVATALISRYHWKQNFISQVEIQLKQSLETLVRVYDSKNNKFKNICAFAKNTTDFRLTVISFSGVVNCDSQKMASQMDNHLNRPEIIEAKNKGWGYSIRHSATLDQDMFYGAIKWKFGKRDRYLRKSIQLSSMERALSKIDKYIFIFLIPVLLVLASISVLIWYKYDSKKQEQLEKLKIDLVSNISHEVRTPLTSIKGFVQLLMSSEQNLSETGKDSLEKIVNNTNRLNSLFSEILNLNKIEKKKTIKLEAVDLNILLDDILSNFELLYKSKSIKVVKDLEQSIIQSDYELIEHILVNLIENAFKYNKDNGQINIQVNSSSNKVQISIKDNGIGIPKHHLLRIFERFYRVENSRSRNAGGSGLGLAIVKHAVTHLDGDVRVESTEGKSTRFIVTI